MCVNCGGNVGDVDLQFFSGTIDQCLDQLEQACLGTYSLRDLGISRDMVASDAERDRYSFATTYPKITKHVSFAGRKRFIQVGTAWGGALAHASRNSS